jgi:putative tryptophan/tyrosine transport system ATP-binding protein
MSLKCEKIGYLPEGRTIFSDLSLQVQEGEFLILLGHNGSGKSSLLRLINGLARPHEGEISLANRSLLNLSIEERARTVATLSQEPDRATFAALTVGENCKIARMRGGRLLTPDDLPASLAGRYHEQVGRLSGGERQLLALTIALAIEPRLLLLDEHTSALDPKVRRRVMDQTAERVAECQVTTVMATHDLEDAISYGDRLVLLREGRVCLDLQGEEKRQVTRAELLTYY